VPPSVVAMRGFLKQPARAYPDAPPHGAVPRVRARSRHARARRSAPAPDAPRRPAAVRTRTVARLERSLVISSAPGSKGRG
jgi:hypothetical protein